MELRMYVVVLAPLAHSEFRIPKPTPLEGLLQGKGRRVSAPFDPMPSLVFCLSGASIPQPVNESA